MLQSHFRPRNCRPGWGNLALQRHNQYLSGEVASYLTVTERTIYRLAAAKKIPAFKVGGSRRFFKEDIGTWIRDQNALKKAN